MKKDHEITSETIEHLCTVLSVMLEPENYEKKFYDAVDYVKSFLEHRCDYIKQIKHDHEILVNTIMESHTNYKIGLSNKISDLSKRLPPTQLDKMQEFDKGYATALQDFIDKL